MTSVYAYLRVSGKSQVRRDGFLRQFLAIREYCKANDLRIVRIFRERGVCGATELEDRPALSALFNCLEEDGIKTIVIEKLDRMARDLMVQETIIKDMQKSGYALLSACEPDLCSQDPSRVLIRRILGAFAEYEKQMLVLKLRGARQRKKARGERGEGRHAFGEKPGEPDTLNAILMLSSLGLTTYQIAEKLNSDGIKSRTSKSWRASVISKILSRERQKAA